MMKTLRFSLFIIIFFSKFLLSQQLLKIDNGCDYSGDIIKTEVYSFDSNLEAEEALKRVMKYTGLPANFIIKEGNVPNAQAVIYNSTRYIFYNQLFMIKIKQQTNTDWAAISILAHEIGHHLSGHTLDLVGSRPSKELEADRFSGFILAKMGASIDEALIAINSLPDAQGSATHPPRSARVAAITNGWQSARDIDKIPEKKNIPTTTGAIPWPQDNKVWKSPIDNDNIREKEDIPLEEKEPSHSRIFCTITNVWTETNIFENSIKGMKIHVKFDVGNMQYVRGLVGAFFFYNNGSILKDFNGVYCSKDGQVASVVEFTPNFLNTTFNDLVIFIPYDELHMNKGRYDLMFSISIYEFSERGNPINIGRSMFIPFQYTNY